jgi:hypothetical protein
MLSKTLAGLALGAATAEAFAPTPMGMFGSRAGIEKRAGIAAQPLVAAPVASRRATVSAVQGLKAAETKTGLPASVKPGVVTGQALVDLLQYAKDKKFAMPGVNIVGTNSINACMEAAAKYGGPIMVTFSKGGGQFIAGKTLNNDNDQASIAGTIAGARHVREVAKLYGEKSTLLPPLPPHFFRETQSFVGFRDGRRTHARMPASSPGLDLGRGGQVASTLSPASPDMAVAAGHFGTGFWADPKN